MVRPANYNTRHKKAILDYLKSVKDEFVTATQIGTYLQKEQIVISRPTIYRQLERLVKEGAIRKVVLDGTSGSCFQYKDQAHQQDCYHLKCEICNGIFDLKCDEVHHVSQHIFENHAFQVNDSKTIFYGKCKVCQDK